MCRVPVKLRELVKQRLAAAAEEIFELLERTIAEYEEELVSKYEEQRQQGALYSLDRGPPSVGAAEWDPEPPQVKEEQEEESSGQEALHSDIIRSQLCSGLKTEEQLSESEELSGVSVKTEEDETWTQPVPLPPPGGALLHHNQTVDCPGSEQDWTQPSVPLSPPGGALLPHNKRSAHSPRKRHRGVRDLIRCHVCPSCGKAFPANSMLERHMRVHTGERPFSCSVCGKRFSQKGNLQSHMLVHTGESPFSCSLCGKSLKTSRNLRQHLSRHERSLTLVT